jgi:hypothetical protein
VEGSGRRLFFYVLSNSNSACLFAYKAYSSNLKKETVHISEMSVINYQIIWRHIPENTNMLYSFPACALLSLRSRKRQYCLKDFNGI